MAMYKFMMSCGHEAYREVVEPDKYYNLDKEYYSKQGLCDECWEDLRKQVKKRQVEQKARFDQIEIEQMEINRFGGAR